MKKVGLAVLLVSLVVVLSSCGGGGGNDGEPLSSAKTITSYSLAGVTGTINETEKTIAVTMPYGTDVTALVANFTTTGASVKVGQTDQASGTTANDFTSPVIYTVTAADNSTAIYTVTVTIDCAYDRLCSSPSGTGGDQICISGRVVEGADLMKAIDASTAENIEVRIYETLNFLSDPTSPPFETLTTANGMLDSCGRFTTRFSVSSDAPNGNIAIVTTDLTGAGTSNYVLGATIRSVMANTNITSARAYTFSKAQDQAWATTAGLSSGTFASVGSLAVRYHEGGYAGEALPGMPVKGIVPNWNGVTDASKDFFFSDSSLTTAQTVSSSMNVTGSNGISLLRIGKGIGNVGAGSACIESGGAAGTLIVNGPTLTGATDGAIIFHDVSVSCF